MLLLLLVDIILLCFNLVIFSLVINCMQCTICMDHVQYCLSYTLEQRESLVAKAFISESFRISGPSASTPNEYASLEGPMSYLVASNI